MQVITFQILCVIVNTYISFTEKKRNIYIATFLFNLFQLFMYFFNDDKTTALVYVIGTIMSFVYIYKDKIRFKARHIIPVFFVACQLILGFMTMQRPIQIISIITPCVPTLYLWYCKNTQGLRIGNIITNTSWGVYNILTGLYIVVITRVIAIITNVIAFIQNKKGKELSQ